MSWSAVSLEQRYGQRLRESPYADAATAHQLWRTLQDQGINVPVGGVLHYHYYYEYQYYSLLPPLLYISISASIPTTTATIPPTTQGCASLGWTSIALLRCQFSPQRSLKSSMGNLRHPSWSSITLLLSSLQHFAEQRYQIL